MDVAKISGRKLDVAKYLSDNGVVVHAVKRLPDGRVAWTLKECPFNDSHRNGDAAIMQAPDGTLSAKCFHAGCQGQGWAAFRQRIGPIKASGHLSGGSTRPGQQASVGYDLELCTNADLFADTTEIKYLVNNVIAEGQPLILGGAGKTLKTSLAVDLAVSLASGEPFLGQFAVDRPSPVLFISAESGKPVLRDVMRACCWAKNVDPCDLPIHWSFRRPNLADLGQLGAVLEAIEAHAPRLVILDPTYLLLMGGDTDRTKNLFAMGAVLGALTDTICASGATLMLLHHVNKGTARNKKETIGLADLAYAGFAEWARQWILVSRWEEYVPGSGQHALHLTVGGSAGHSGAWVARINEGRPTDPLIGRLWSVELENPQRAHDRSDEAADTRIALAILKTAPKGLTKTELRQQGQWSGDRVNQILDALTASFAVRGETVGSKTVYLACED